MVVKQHQWRDTSYYREVGDAEKTMWEGHHTLVHEYAHVVQAHISSLYSELGTDFFRDSGYFESKTPIWIVEGTARFVEDVQRTSEGFVNLRESRIEAVNNVVGKQTLIGSSGLDVYPFRRAAFHLIASLTSIESWLDIFREMAVVEFGPSRAVVRNTILSRVPLRWAYRRSQLKAFTIGSRPGEQTIKLPTKR